MSTEAIALRNAAYDMVKDLSMFKSVRKTPFYSFQSEWLPLLSVYLIRDAWVPDGDPRAGPPDFVCTATIGFSGLCVSSDDGKAEDNLEQAMLAIEQAILVDDGRSSNKLFHAPGAPLEGLGNISRQHVYTREGETPISEIRLSVDLLYRTEWPPVIRDDLKVIHVTVKPKLDQGDPAHEDTIERQYDIPQNP